MLGLSSSFALTVLLFLRSVPGSSAHFLALRVASGSGLSRSHRHGRELISSFGLPLNGSVNYGYYYTTVRLGTPGQKFAVIVDTGSSTFYVPCASCGTKCGGNHLNPPFDPAASSTAEVVPCNSLQCACIGDCGCINGQCSYVTMYMEGSNSSGLLVSDLLGLNGSAPAARIVFGCETQETGSIFNQMADGIFGLANSNNSVINQLVREGVVDNMFSLCLGDEAGDGLLVLGSASLANDTQLQYTPLLPTADGYYYVNLTGVALAGQALPEGQATFRGGALLDSGTTFSRLPTSAFKALVAELGMRATAAGLSRVQGPDPRYEDICWSGLALLKADNLSVIFPDMQLQFDQMPPLALPPGNYLFARTAGIPARGVCLGIFDNGDAGTLLGAIALKDMLVQFDRAKKRVGFSNPVQCTEPDTYLQA